MIKEITFTLILTIIISSVIAQDQVRIYGKVTNFNGNPIDSVNIRLKGRDFKNCYETLSNKDGEYSMMVDQGDYTCLYALKVSDWIENKLEYWAWNFPAFQDIEINPQYQQLEIYGLNVFEPQLGPYETYMVYFRPMSLKKIHHLMDELQTTKVSDVIKQIPPGDTLQIAPSNLTNDEFNIQMNGQPCKILGIHQAVEYVRGFYEHTYLVQILKPEDRTEKVKGYDQISVIIHSKETDETGKAEFFFEKKE